MDAGAVGRRVLRRPRRGVPRRPLVRPQAPPAGLADRRRHRAGHRARATSSAASAACWRAAATASRRRCPGASPSRDTFAASNVGTPLHVALHPTQLYDGGAELADPRCSCCSPSSGGGSAPGWTFWVYILLYAVSRYVVEMFRGDPRGMTMGFSTSQFISLVLIPLALVMLFVLVALGRSRAGRRRTAPRRAASGQALSAGRRDAGMERRSNSRSTRSRPGSGSTTSSWRRWPGQSRTAIQRLIKQGAITVNGQPSEVQLRNGSAGDLYLMSLSIPPPEPRGRCREHPHRRPLPRRSTRRHQQGGRHHLPPRRRGHDAARSSTRSGTTATT